MEGSDGMSLPMTIHEARAMQEADVALDDAAVRQAEADATEAEEAAATLERSAVEGGQGSAAPAAVVEQRAVAEFARKRAGRIRAAANRAKAARRVLALADVGKDVEQIHADASQADAGMIAAMNQISGGYAMLRQLADAHSARVTAAIERARELGAEPAAPSGPRASSAHVTVHTGLRKIQSGNMTVQRVDKSTVDEAVELALKGKPDDAVRRLSAAHTVAPPPRADFYYLAPNGIVHGLSDNVTGQQMAKKAANGDGRLLGDDEIEAYLAGRFDGHQAKR
jgi:hypothetical protein